MNESTRDQPKKRMFRATGKDLVFVEWNHSQNFVLIRSIQAGAYRQRRSAGNSGTAFSKEQVLKMIHWLQICARDFGWLDEKEER
jgi:hypothetical protein